MRRHCRASGLLLILFAVLAGCAQPTDNGITQVATIDALLAGVYDGHMSLETLRRHGDFGLGTFEGLDGEMVLLDGIFYQVRADGRVYRPPSSQRTPFASVTHFVADQREELTGPMDMRALEARINERVPEPNRFCAFLVQGEFRHVRTRSVPAQSKPYPPLVEVTKQQPVFQLEQVRGVLVGFRSPEFVKGVNVPGFHMHFLTDERTAGGHVLDLELVHAHLEMDTVHEWLHIFLPPASGAFSAADLARDRGRELQAVEQEKSATPMGGAGVGPGK